jgi:ribonuclease H / adenosylcobalamin/alpha-ribazole phosphatase
VFVDSELVVGQVNDRAKVVKEHIRPLHAEACSLLDEFSNYRVSWIPRKWNAEADELANKALPGQSD